jgi:ABC-type glycerol-3-phosphate transport system substrate-binding protein
MFQSLQTLWEEKRILVIAVISIIVLIFGGALVFILSSNNQPNLPTIEPNPTVQLTWWKADQKDIVYSEIVQAFRQIPGNNNVNIQFVNKELNSQYYSNLITDLARGIGPDILTIQNIDLPAYKEFLSPIDSIRGAKLTNYKDDFVNLAVRDTMDKDKVYCVTSELDTLQLYYNAELLRQNRISRPAETWAELDNQISRINRLESLNSNEFKISTISLGVGGRSVEGRESNIRDHEDIIAALIFQYGDQIYDYQKEQSVFGQKNEISNSTNSELDTDSNTFKALEYYQSFGQVNTSRYSWSKNNPNNLEMFAQGRLAYLLGYKTYEVELKKINPRLNLDVAPIPQFNKSNERTIGRFNMDCLNANLAKNANLKNVADQDKYEKAQEFLEFLTKKENQEIIANKTDMPSAHKDIIDLQLDGEKKISTFASGTIIADNFYQPDVFGVKKSFSGIFERTVYNNISLQDSLSQAIKEYNQIINTKPRLRGQ